MVASLSSPASPPPPPAASPGETGLFGAVCCPGTSSFWATPCCLLFFLAITTVFVKRFGQVCTSFGYFKSTLSFLLRPQNVLYLSSQDNSQYGGGLAHSGVHRLKILLAKRLHSHAEKTTAAYTDGDASAAMFSEGNLLLPPSPDFLIISNEKTIKQALMHTSPSHDGFSIFTEEHFIQYI